MKCGEPFAVTADIADLYSNNIGNLDNDYSFCRTNIWNSSFDNPEINCDFAVLHSDLTEIKELVREIGGMLKEYFCEE